MNIERVVKGTIGEDEAIKVVYKNLDEYLYLFKGNCGIGELVNDSDAYFIEGQILFQA